MDFVTHAALLASIAVAGLTQLLKLNIIPFAFPNKYPVPTNIILSIAAAIWADWKDIQHVSGWTSWVGTVAVIAVAAALIYNQLLGRWNELKAMEGPGK